MNAKSIMHVLIIASISLSSALVCAEDIVLLPQQAELTPGATLNHGKYLRWSGREGRAEWTFTVEKEADYNLFYRQNVGNKSILNVFLDGEELFKKETKGPGSYFGTYKMNEQKFHLTKGTHTLSLGPDASSRAGAGTIWSLLLTERNKTRDMVDSSYYEKKTTFAETMVHLRNNHPELAYMQHLFPIDKKLWRDFPHQMAWLGQDLVDEEEGRNNPKIKIQDTIRTYFQQGRSNMLELELINRVLKELPEQNFDRSFIKQVQQLPPSDPRLIQLYEGLCRERRAKRLEPLLKQTKEIIFAKHQVFGMNSGIYNITEYEGLYVRGPSGLYSIDLNSETKDQFANVTSIFQPKNGMVRDPELSYDAKRLLFAWRKSIRDVKNFDAPEKDNYQIYEMDLASKEMKQLTTDETYGANFSPCYTPDDNILFNSSRIVQHITCGWGDHSNLFLMDKDGKYQRRVGS